MSRWSEQTTVKFVKLYSQHECLWNTSSSQYRNKELRNDAVMKIVEEMALNNFGLIEAKQKIKNLRSTYGQEINKIKTCQSYGNSYKPTLKWFPIMHAVVNKMTIKTETDSFDTFSEPTSFQDEQDIQEDDEDIKDFVSESYDVNDTNANKRPRIVSVTSVNMDPVQVFRNERSNDDECDIFGKHVAVQLKKLSTNGMLLAQKDIQAVITKYRLQESQSSSNSFYSQSLELSNDSLA